MLHEQLICKQHSRHSVPTTTHTLPMQRCTVSLAHIHLRTLHMQHGSPHPNMLPMQHVSVQPVKSHTRSLTYRLLHRQLSIRRYSPRRIGHTQCWFHTIHSCTAPAGAQTTIHTSCPSNKVKIRTHAKRLHEQLAHSYLTPIPNITQGSTYPQVSMIPPNTTRLYAPTYRVPQFGNCSPPPNSRLCS